MSLDIHINPDNDSDLMSHIVITLAYLSHRLSSLDACVCLHSVPSKGSRKGAEYNIIRLCRSVRARSESLSQSRSPSPVRKRSKAAPR